MRQLIALDLAGTANGAPTPTASAAEEPSAGAVAQARLGSGGVRPGRAGPGRAAALRFRAEVHGHSRLEVLVGYDIVTSSSRDRSGSVGLPLLLSAPQREHRHSTPGWNYLMDEKKGNGRFPPSWQTPRPTEGEPDFPRQEEYRDASGVTRLFEINVREVGSGWLAQAREIREGAGEDGYVFRRLDSANPYRALGRLRQAIERELATRYLVCEHGKWYPTHDVLEGRIEDRDGEAVFFVDGRMLTLREFGAMVEPGSRGWCRGESPTRRRRRRSLFS